ncbi:unnamed protein product [Candida parapsilosis]
MEYRHAILFSNNLTYKIAEIKSGNDYVEGSESSVQLGVNQSCTDFVFNGSYGSFGGPILFRSEEHMCVW